MKKLIAFLLAAIMLLSLCACGENAGSEEKKDNLDDNLDKVKSQLCNTNWGYWEYMDSDHDTAKISFFWFRKDGTAKTYYYRVNNYSAKYTSGSDATYQINSDGTITMTILFEDGTSATRPFLYTFENDKLRLTETFSYTNDKECFSDIWLDRIWGQELSKVEDSPLEYLEEHYSDYRVEGDE